VIARPGAGESGRTAEYFEPARSYVSSWALLAGLLIGMVIDLALGGAAAHLAAWLLAIVIVVGFDAFIVRTARRLRSVTVSADEIRVGEQSIDRSDVVAVERDVDPMAPMLGQRLGEGSSRAAAGLTVLLRDGSRRTVPTRYPDRVVAALGLARVRVPVEVRQADPDDVDVLGEIDRRAETLYRVSGIDLPAKSFLGDTLHEARVVLVTGRPIVGYVRIDDVDGSAHVRGPAVVPGSMRQGIGSELVEAACRWARANGYRAATVTTFAQVPWNAPFFRRRGFVEITELTPELAQRRDWERAIGLDGVGPRVVMRRDLAD
jgi:GNAT superfamily N-acetyltransferase